MLFRTVRISLLCCGFLFMQCIIIKAQNKPGIEAIHSLIGAEKSLQGELGYKGQRLAFLDVLRPNAVLFKPGPVTGPDYILHKKEYKGGLFRHPAWAEVSRDGDFGYTTGPYTYLLNDTTFYGEYVSIWLRGKYQPVWRLFLDASINHRKVKEAAPAISYPEINVTADQPIYPKVIASSKDILFSTDELFATFLNTRSLESAYKEYLDKNSRMLVEGHMPINGRDSILSYLTGTKGSIRTRTTAAYVCYARDMGFTYGTGEFVDAYRKNPRDHKFNYVRIWRKGGDGIWRVIMEMQLPG